MRLIHRPLYFVRDRTLAELKPIGFCEGYVGQKRWHSDVMGIS